ncbi:MAG: Lin1244/Lin1753 domain-containing protein [Ignavibacteria bacterium]|jgi:hypothetical protein
MAAGRKLTITADYFPHFSKMGTPVRIIESKFGNDGYAAYYKLRELLGQSPGHTLDLRAKIKYLDVLSYLKVEDSIFRQIIHILIECEEIDEDLWKENILYSEQFIHDLSRLYSKRDTIIEDKPALVFGKLQLNLFTKSQDRVIVSEQGDITTENLTKKYKIERKEFSQMAEKEKLNFMDKVLLIFKEKYEKNKGVKYGGKDIDKKHLGLIQKKFREMYPTYNTEQMIQHYDSFFDAVTSIKPIDKNSEFYATIDIPFLSSQLDKFIQHINNPKYQRNKSTQNYEAGIVS